MPLARTLLIGIALCGCGAESPQEPPVATVDPPFPSDIFTVENSATSTGLGVDLGRVPAPLLEPVMSFNLWQRDKILRWTETLDGFSTFAPLFWITPEAVDRATLDASSPAAPPHLFLVNLQRSSPRWGERVAISASYESVEDEILGPLSVIHLAPLAPLEPGSLHGVVATRQIRTEAGEPLAMSDFFAVLAGRRELVGDSPMHEPMERLRERARPLFEYLAEQELSVDEIAHAFVFTTQSARALLTAARTQLRGPEAPPLDARWQASFAPADFPDLPEGVDPADLTDLSAIVTGEVTVPDLRDEDGAIAWPLRSESQLSVPLLIALPAAKEREPFPVVVLQHGHGGNKEFALYVAPYFAARGIATVAIDHMGHGALAHTGSFIDILDMQRFRGNMVQTAVNALRLIQFLGSLETVEADGATYRITTARGIGYIGESLGGITGVPVSAVEPDVGIAVFNVAGGGLSASLAGSYLKLMSKNKLLLRLGFTAVFQMLLDQMDPASFGGLLYTEVEPSAGKPVLMQNVASDPIGTETAETLAAAIGAAYVCPCPSEIPLPRLQRKTAPTAPPGLFYFEQGKHGFLLANASDPTASAAVRRQAAHFFATHFDGSGAMIVDPNTL